MACKLVLAARNGTITSGTRIGILGLVSPVTTVIALMYSKALHGATFLWSAHLSCESKYVTRSIKLRVAYAKTEDSIRQRKNMGRKYKHLFEQVITIDNLRDAYHKTVKGSNRFTPGHLHFKENLEANLEALQTELLNDTYVPSPCHHFIVFEPKKREITSLVFRDRVLQHAIFNIVEPLFDKVFYSCSYACRNQRGTHKGVKDVQATLRHMQKSGEVFYLKMDFSKYFKNIDKEILFKEYRRKISDERLLNLMWAFDAKRESGISIGFLLSQLGANLYGHMFDRFIKTRLHVKHYFRYMDDTVILSHDKNLLRQIQRKLRLFSHVFMHLSFSHWHIEKLITKPLNFLGYRMSYFYKLIRKDSVTRAKRKIKTFIRLKLVDDLLKFLASWLGHIRWADSFNLLNYLREEYRAWKRQALISSTALAV